MTRLLIADGLNYRHRPTVFYVLDWANDNYNLAAVIHAGHPLIAEWCQSRDVCQISYAGTLDSQAVLDAHQPELVIVLQGERGYDLGLAAQGAGIEVLRLGESGEPT
jgi:hypothetical protein